MRFSRRQFLLQAAIAACATAVRAEPPLKVVTLEWAETEIALLLGLPPVGVADLAGYRQWVGVDNDRLADAVDVGGRQQPSLEALMRLKPDLILTSALRHAAIAARLKAVAPTILLDAATENGDLYQNMRQNLLAVAEALGRSAGGMAEWKSFEDKLVVAGGKLPAKTKVVVAQPLPGVARLRVFAANSAVMKTLMRAGMAEGVDLAPQPFGFTTFGLEELAALDADTHLCLLDKETPQELTASAIWPVLPMVATGHVHQLGRDIWPFGSTRSMLRLTERAVAAL